MAAIICGSLAFDTIMGYAGRFAQQILPEQLHILNVSFLVPDLRREYGGCAGNIAYGLHALGGRALPMATLGHDGQGYLQRLRDLGIDTSLVRLLPDTYTAQAMIMTDLDNNQITAFHPGAMSYAHLTPVPALSGPCVGIVSPDGREAMLQHARQFQDLGIPFVFDPGQGLPMFNGEELVQFIGMATWIAVNDYEGQMLCERTGWSCAEIACRVQGLVVTRGAEGSEIWTDSTCTKVPATHPEAVVDPTGCGDAFRAALLYGLERGWSLQRCAALGGQVAAKKIAQRGGQNYQLDRAALGLE